MFEENSKLASCQFQIGRCLYSSFSLQWYVLSMNYIILFDMLLLVNVANFVAVLWLCWLDACLHCLLLQHLYHTLLVICILHLLDHNIHLNLQTGLFQNFLLLQFHVGTGSYSALVEHRLIHSNQFPCIFNCRRCFICRRYPILLHYICHLQKFLHHNPLL